MKKYYLLFVLLSAYLAPSACPVCEQAQPRILRGITHGVGPDTNWDYTIPWVAGVIVFFTLFFSLKWLIQPGEKNQRHIKRLILNFD